MPLSEAVGTPGEGVVFMGYRFSVTDRVGRWVDGLYLLEHVYLIFITRGGVRGGLRGKMGWAGARYLGAFLFNFLFPQSHIKKTRRRKKTFFFWLVCTHLSIPFPFFPFFQLFL